MAAALVALLAGLGAVGLRALTADENASSDSNPEPSASPVPPTTGGTTEPTDPGPSQLIPADSATATAERDSVNLRCTGAFVSYGAELLIDGDENTGWGAGADDGTGQQITIRFARPVELTSIGLTPGYTKVGPRSDTDCASVSAFDRNRFVTSVQYEFDDGTTAVQNFEPRPEIQSIPVDVETTSVTMTILGTSLPPGADDDTILSEIQFMGRDLRG